MKITSRVFLVLAAAAALVGSCSLTTGSDDDNPDTVNGVDYSNFSPASIFVRNNTGKRLVAFKGSLSENNLISGIPATTGNHGLKPVERLFQTSSDFALTLITEEQYRDYKSNLNALENTPFARLYAFYNRDGTNDNVYEISSKIGGSRSLILNNITNYNVEIHRNSPTGEVLGYVAANTVQTRLFLQPDQEGYMLFPVFRKYIRKDNEIYSTIPTFITGSLANKPYFDVFVLDDADESWNLTELFTQDSFNLTTGGARLVIHNISSTSVRLAQGNMELLTSKGVKDIKSATQDSYVIEFTKLEGGTYEQTQLVGGYRVGSVASPIPIPEFNAKIDTTYHVYIGGTNQSTLELRNALNAGSYTDVTTDNSGLVGEGTILNLEAIFAEN
jgi:hypothetical protein